MVNSGTKIVSSKINRSIPQSSYSGLGSKVFKPGSCEGSGNTKMFSVNNLCSSQSKRRVQINSEPIKAKQIPQSAKISHVLTPHFEETFETRVLDGKTRHKRCVRSCPDSSNASEILSLSIPTETVLFPGSSLWSRRSTLRFHKDHVLPCKHHERKGRQHYFLPGRFHRLGGVQRNSPKKHNNGCRDANFLRFRNKFSKVRVKPQTKSGVARSTMVFKGTNSRTDSFVSEKSGQSGKSHSQNEESIKEGSGSLTGFDGFCRPVSPPGQTESAFSTPIDQEIALHQKRFEEDQTSGSKQKNFLVVTSEKPERKVRSKIKSPKQGSLDRCVPVRLWGTLRGRRFPPRKVGGGTGWPPHKRQRIIGCSPWVRFGFSSERRLGRCFHRQSPSLLLPLKKRVESVSGAPNHLREDLGDNYEAEPVDTSISHCGIKECNSRCLVERQGSPYRMVSKSVNLRGPNLEPGLEARIGCNGNSLECQASPIHMPFRTSESNGNRFLFNKLKQVEVNISVPSSENDFEGFRKTDYIQRKGLANCSNIQIPTLVSNVTRESTSNYCPQSPSSSVDSGTSASPPQLSWRTLSRVGILEGFYSSKFSSGIANRLVNSCRKSTLNNYDRCWKEFQKFAIEKDIASPSEKNVLEFLEFLFAFKKLSPRTILNYRAAISKPLNALFGLDFKEESYPLLARAQFIDRPPTKRILPKWNLDNVLRLLREERFCHPPVTLEDQLVKTIFLVALASGNRASEITATRRDTILFRNNDTEVILPVRPGFLFKNQRIDKTPPNIIIKSLVSEAGSVELCPVQNLKLYLRRSQSTARGDAIFLHPVSGRNLQRPSLSLRITRLIEEACPNSMPRMHDIRKQAVSLAWTRGIPPSEIVAAAFWTSSNVFVKHYLKTNVQSDIPCVALNSQ